MFLCQVCSVFPSWHPVSPSSSASSFAPALLWLPDAFRLCAAIDLPLSALLTQVLVWLFGVCFEDYRFYIYIFILFLFIVSFSVSLSVLFTAHCSVFLVNSCWDKNISQCSSTHNTPLLMQAISETVPVLCQCWLILSCALCPQYVFQILCSNQ